MPLQDRLAKQKRKCYFYTLTTHSDISASSGNRRPSMGTKPLRKTLMPSHALQGHGEQLPSKEHCMLQLAEGLVHLESQRLLPEP